MPAIIIKTIKPAKAAMPKNAGVLKAELGLSSATGMAAESGMPVATASAAATGVLVGESTKVAVGLEAGVLAGGSAKVAAAAPDGTDVLVTDGLDEPDEAQGMKPESRMEPSELL